MDGKAFETRLNVLIGRLLSRELSLKAISESLSSRKRPDVIVFINGVKVIIEGSYSKQDAEADITEKLEKGLADLGIALHYKEKFPSYITDSELENKIKMSAFGVRLIVPRDISETLIAYFKNQKILPEWITNWIEIETLAELLPILSDAIQFILSERDIEQITNKIEESINEFVFNTESVDSNKQIAKALYDIFYRLYGLSVGNYEEIDELIYAKAALTILLSEAHYQSVRAQAGIADLTSFIHNYGYRLGIRKAFEEIISNVNYEPVYQVALQVINVLPDDLSLSLRRLTELAMEISSKRTFLRKDFAGKIYHKVVGEWAVRKGFATFFTTVPAAYLLAYLTIFTKTGVFSEFKRIKLADIACGSGTLLTASYNALKDLYIYSSFKQGDDINLEAFHRQMLEEDLWALDALRYAVQIASTNLALQNPTVKINKMNTFAIPLGVEGNGPHPRVILGSLEFLEGLALPSISKHFVEDFEKYPFIKSAKPASITESKEIPSEITEFDLLIMNPPFLRATGRGRREGGGLFGFIVDEPVRKAILDKYDEKRKNVQKFLHNLLIPRMQVFEKELLNIGQAGEGLLFLYLAYKLLKDEGKIAFVLPKSLLTGISWFLARNLLLEKFHLEHIVVSYDANKGYNFSESTSLSETLIVAKKREKASENEETKITLLLSKPSTSLEARALAFKIINIDKEAYVEVNGAKAYVYKVPRDALINRLHNWGSLLAFPDPKLTKMANELLSGRLYERNIPITLLGKITNITGLAVRRGTFHSTFRQVAHKIPGVFPAIIGGKEDIRLTMHAEPNAWVICSNAEKFYSTSSKFLIPDRVWIDTMHAIALACDKPVVASMFFGLKPKLGIKITENCLKALILWFNTTWGILTFLANRGETRGRWIELTITKWKLQPVLDVTKLDDAVVEKVAKVFDTYCKRSLRRLPEQFNPDDIDPVRLGIDKEFLDSLGIEVHEGEIKELYKLIYENLSRWIKGEELIIEE